MLTAEQIDRMPRENMDYLGDGVYVIYDGCGVWLHANDHRTPTDRIYMEPEVIAAFKAFLQRVQQ